MTGSAALAETLRKVFKDEKLDGLIGYAAGTTPLRPRPAVFTAPGDFDAAVFDGFCVQNLATYLRRHPDRRMGILVKGCDRRAVTVLIQERQVAREDLFLIGVPCPGMLNRARLLTEFPGLETGGVAEEGDTLTVAAADGPVSLARADYLLPACRACRHRVPTDVDLMLDAPPFAAPEADTSLGELTGGIDGMERRERAALFAEELSRCILCYACRNVCPFCYCETCFTDTLQPAWMTPAPEPNDIFFYHFNRMMHMSGRCVACGSCAWACPEQIPLHLLFGKITADVAELFAFEAGLDETTPQPMSHFSEDDPDEHIG